MLKDCKIIIVSPKAGILWIMQGHHLHLYTGPCPQRFSCVQPTSHSSLGFLLNFASALLWQRSGHPILLVAQESKLCSWESKTSKDFTCNLKTVAFREFCLNMFFSYFWVICNIVKLQTCRSLHSPVIAT